MRKNNISSFNRLAALAMGLGLLTGNSIPATAAGNNVVQEQSRKDAVNQQHLMPRPVSKGGSMAQAMPIGISITKRRKVTSAKSASTYGKTRT